jgi:hypothetical protein
MPPRAVKGGLRMKRKRAKPGECAAFFARAVAHRADECLLWPFARKGPGYAGMVLNGVTVNVHREVCKAVYGPPPTERHQACHSCRNATKGCIAPAHLKWKTPDENQADRIADGTHIRGERHPCVKLNEAQVKFIKASSMSGAFLAAYYGVSRATISKIRLGRIWKHLER